MSWHRTVETIENKKITNYSPMAKEIRKMQWLSTKNVSLVVGCLAVVSGQLEDFF